MLQRGFGERRGRDHHIWVYTNTKPPERTVTRLFGFEKHFYGPAGSAADEKITEYENESQSVIQDIRKLPNGSKVDPDFAATLIAHLEMRTEFLREDVSRKMQKGVSELVKQFKCPNSLRAAMTDYLKSNPEELEKLLGKGFVPPHQRPAIAEIAQLIVESTPDDEILAYMEPGLGEMGDLVHRFPELIKDAQNNSLSQEPESHLRINTHLDRIYHVFRPSDGSLILPDTTLAFVKKRSGASPFSQKNDKIEAVILPVSSECAIVGAPDFDAKYTLKTVNRLLASCSFKAFIANEKTPSFESLTQRIGKYAHLISEKELRRRVGKAGSAWSIG